MNPIDIIHEYYHPDSKACKILLTHCSLVTKRAIDIVLQMGHMKPDLQLIREAGMLHDIGIFMTNAPDIGCTGDYPYICHGYLGREILESKGLPRHALICERHVGIGITADEIKSCNLPLPERDMVPVSIEEKLISYADKFFSKNPDAFTKEKSVEDIIRDLHKHGHDQAEKFRSWIEYFSASPKF